MSKWMPFDVCVGPCHETRGYVRLFALLSRGRVKEGNLVELKRCLSFAPFVYATRIFLPRSGQDVDRLKEELL